jgi:hypothetical protein
MSGWLRHLALNAQARIGVSPQIIVWSIVAALAATAAMVFLCIAAFIWLADRYDAVIAGLVLGGGFALLAVVAIVAGLIARRRNMERARLELAARSSASWLDPKLMAMGFQVGQAIGWRKLASLAAVGLLAAGLAKEWFGEREAGPESDETPPAD